MTLLSTVGSPAALDAIEARLDDEADDEIRDAMLLALDAARAASGKEVTREEIADRVTRAAKKLQAPVAAWLDESRLPPLRYARRHRSSAPRATRFLLYRQSRAREMRARRRGPAALRPDRPRRPAATSPSSSSGSSRRPKADAADRWVLAVTGLLGDDRVVPTLNSLDPAVGRLGRGARWPSTACRPWPCWAPTPP